METDGFVKPTLEEVFANYDPDLDDYEPEDDSECPLCVYVGGYCGFC
jgi:hypothetical protein